jgi:hypothetical protein
VLIGSDRLLSVIIVKSQRLESAGDRTDQNSSKYPSRALTRVHSQGYNLVVTLSEVRAVLGFGKTIGESDQKALVTVFEEEGR